MKNRIVNLVLQNKILFLILLVAAILRFIGTDPGYNQFHADEGISYSAAVSMIKNGNLDPLRYDYPALVPDINYIFFKFIFIPLNWLKYYITHIPDIIDGVVHIPIAPLEKNTLFQTYILADRNINALHWGRYVTALFSLLDVLLTYLVAKKLFSRPIGLIAAFLLTFNFKHVINSHIGLPDVYNAFFVLLTLLLCINLQQKPTLKNYLLTSFAVGLSFSVKYQIFAIFPFLLTHLLISFENFRLNFKKLFNPHFFLSLILIPVTFAVTNPYFFIHFNPAMKSIADVSRKYGMGTNQLNLYPLSYWYHIDYGAPLFITAAIGILIALKKFTKETLMLLSFLLPFMFIMNFYSRGGFYIRNFITSTPLLMIFASIAIWFFFDQCKVKLGNRVGIIFLIVFLPITVFTPGRNAIINSISYTKPWGYDQMRPWVAENLPPGVTVATHPFDAVNLKIKNKQTEFEIAGNFSLAEHKEHGASYVLLDLNWVGYPFYFWMSYGFDDLQKYWNKPLDIMRNTYHGIATEELFRYQLHAVTKPWQAPDTHLLVIKLPDWPKTEMLNVKTFDFEEDVEKWSLRGTQETASQYYHFDPEVGKENNGSLIFKPIGTKYPTIRAVSEPITIKENHLYKIEGFLKTEIKLEPREREGFLRIDFYGQDINQEKVGIQASVSSRVYGLDNWVKKEIIDRAPKGSTLMTVSLQTYVTTRTKIWLDDVIIWESTEAVEDITTKPPYRIEPIDLNYVYPNSHGNL